MCSYFLVYAHYPPHTFLFNFFYLSSRRKAEGKIESTPLKLSFINSLLSQELPSFLSQLYNPIEEGGANKIRSIQAVKLKKSRDLWFLDRSSCFSLTKKDTKIPMMANTQEATKRPNASAITEHIAEKGYDFPPPRDIRPSTAQPRTPTPLDLYNRRRHSWTSRQLKHIKQRPPPATTRINSSTLRLPPHTACTHIQTSSCIC